MAWVGQASLEYQNGTTVLASDAIGPFANPAEFNFGAAGSEGAANVEYSCATNTSFQASISGNPTPVIGTLSLVGATYAVKSPALSSTVYLDATVGSSSNSVTVPCADSDVTSTQLHFMFTWVQSLTAYTYTVYFRSADPRSTNNGSGEPPHDSKNPQTTNDSSAPTHL
ncbi:hypothetical protein DAPPUDRAFT_279617 [Daphnia pulex]|uniref:Uncharacterized protein n=1 Tax=Daphnia pulex TaxID=6669 RepID=E9I7H9_DAPPU|nr:hypothetical protein DAPPUDRAFT_279617 [Daphnia pulex]|eukprot:EFX60051.1 hypothetical protein DAPPUDRAFT_279617 [Daphnia pulex]